MCPVDLPQVPWIEGESVTAYLAASGADVEQRRFVTDLHRDGVAVFDLGPDALDLIDRAIADAERFFRPGKRRAQDVWRRSRAVRDLASHTKLTTMLALAYGREPFAFQTLNFREGSEQHAHSDVAHFHSQPPRFMCGAWIALEDVAADAGPLFYHPGSHRQRIFEMSDAGVADRRPKRGDYAAHYVEAFARQVVGDPRPALLRKGQVLVWAANTTHGGLAIQRSGATRRSLVTHFFFEDCLYYTPLYSRPQTDELYLRLPADVRTGGVVWPRRGGKPVPLGPRPLAQALRDKLGRTVRVD